MPAGSRKMKMENKRKPNTTTLEKFRKERLRFAMYHENKNYQKQLKKKMEAAAQNRQYEPSDEAYEATDDMFSYVYDAYSEWLSTYEAISEGAMGLYIEESLGEFSTFQKLELFVEYFMSIYNKTVEHSTKNA